MLIEMEKNVHLNILYQNCDMLDYNIYYYVFLSFFITDNMSAYRECV